MTISTKISGYWQRFDGDNLELNHRISESVTVTEGGGNRIVLASNITNISIMPPGLTTVRALYIETDNKLNIEITGVRVASFDIYSDPGVFVMLNASLSNVRLSNRSATVTCNPFYDLSG